MISINIRKEWLNNTLDDNNNSISQYYSAEETISEAKENFDIRRYYSAEGANVSVDGVTCRAIVQYFSNPLNQAKYDRELHVPVDTTINTGSLIVYKNSKWLVTGAVDDLQAYKSAGIVKTNNILNVYKNNTSYEVPCIVENSVQLYRQTHEDNKYFTELGDVIVLRVSNNSTNLLIDIDDVYELGTKFKYVVTNISDVIELGLLVIKLQITSGNIETIPDPDPDIPMGLFVKIIDPTTSIIKNLTADYTSQFYEDGEEIETELATFYLTADDGVSATTLATISEQSTAGTCTVLANNTNVGYVKLWVRNADNSIVSEPVRIWIKSILN